AEWLAGRVPLWDPFRQAGTPMLAEPQIGVLYPPGLIFLSPWSLSLELSLFILLHYSLAAWFAYLLGRAVGLSRVGATLAGLSFGLGGVLMAQVVNLNIMTTVVWLPLVLWAAMTALRRRTWPTALLAGSTLAMQIFAAHGQIIFYTLVTLIGYGLYQIGGDYFFGMLDQRRNSRYAIRSGLLLGAMLLSGLLLSAPQILPLVELLPLTTRSDNQGYALLTENSLPPFMWLNLIQASLFGNAVTGFKIGDPFQEDFIYAGFLPLLLAGLTLLTLWRQKNSDVKRLTLFFVLLLGGGLLLAMGRYTPLYTGLVQYLPGFSLFRIPARWLMVVNLAIAVLAGVGLDTLLKKHLSRAYLLTVAGLSLLILLGQGALWLFRTELLAWAGPAEGQAARLLTYHLNYALTLDPVYDERLWLRQIPYITVPAALAILNAAIALALLALRLADRLSHQALAVLVLGAVAFDLVLAGGTTINPIRPDRWWTQQAGGAAYVLEQIDAQHRVFPLGVSSEAWSISHLGQYYPSLHRINSAGGYASPLRLARYDALLDEADPVRGLEVLSVRYLLTPGQMGADVAATFPLVYQDEESYVYELPNPLPRAFVVPQAVIADDVDEALTYLNDRSLDLRQTVILEPASDQPAPPPANAAAWPAEQTATTTVVSETPQQIEVEVSLPGTGYLVLLDTYYPGWVATVDGRPIPIYRANYLGRAVQVPAGDHRVRFVYRPWSFRVGVAAFLVGLASLGLAFRPPAKLQRLGQNMRFFFLWI
ncbi:MAG: YfhO family protein, partial [Anaerolineae bacterium]|nr:YfhO family protein [Anaerolineae bacterium]